MKREHLSYVLQQTKEIEVYAEDHQYESYGWLEEALEEKIVALEEFGKEHGIPVKIDVNEMMDKHWIGEPESSSYYEEEYSDDSEESSW